MRVSTALRLAALWAAALLSPLAWSQQAYDLRVLFVATGFPPGPPISPALEFQDWFNNGNPLSGGGYAGTLGGPGSYTAANNGFDAGAELNGGAGDWAGSSLGIGRLRLTRDDAIWNPTNLDAPGTASVTNRLRLNDPGPTALLNKSQSFEAFTIWSFTTPDASSAYGLRLSDNPLMISTPGTPFNDLIDLRVVNSGGTPMVHLRRLSYDGIASLTATGASSIAVASALPAGRSLADIGYIELNLHYNLVGAGQPAPLLAGFNLLSTTGEELGGASFASQPTIFNGENFTHMIAGAHWTVPVPEPASALLMLGGLLALGSAGMRRRH